MDTVSHGRVADNVNDSDDSFNELPKSVYQASRLHFFLFPHTCKHVGSECDTKKSIDHAVRVAHSLSLSSSKEIKYPFHEQRPIRPPKERECVCVKKEREQTLQKR
jgi:hypothetical protein